jgi:hypothetical protein
MLQRASLFGVVAALPVALSLPGCGSSTPMLSIVTVEDAIASSIMTLHHFEATVTCPPAVPRKAGLTFTCSARLAVGTYPITVTETNNNGHVRYENQTPLVVLSVSAVERAIVRSIQRQRHLPATVACPSPVLQRKGISFMCTAMAKGRYYHFAVTEVNDNGRIRYVEHR